MDPQIKSLTDWMLRNKLDIETKHSLKLIKSKHEFEGRCVIATENLEPNTTLIEIPVEFMINYRFSLKDEYLVQFFEWCLKEKSIKFTRLESIYFVLIIQTVQQDSFLNDFIKSMPTSYDTPEYYDQRLIQTLPIDLKTAVLKRLDIFEAKFKLYSDLIKQYSDQLTNLNESIKTLLDNFNYSTFKWIFCSVNSRCFHIDEETICSQQEIQTATKLFGNLKQISKQQKKLLGNIKNFEDYEKSIELEQTFNNNQCCLIPYIDFLNHSFKSNAYAFFNEETNCYNLKSCELDPEDEDNQDYKLVKEDQQVYITYGHHDNKTLLIEYGFILEDNIYDKITLNKDNLTSLLKDEADLDCLLNQASSLGLFNDLSFNKSEGPSWYLLKMLDLITCLNKETLKPRAKKLKVSVDIAYSIEIQNLFIEILIKFNKNYRETIENLLELKKISNFSYHIECVLKYCELQTQIVDFNLKLANDNERFTALF